MRHIKLDREDDRVKRFVRSLPLDPEGSILELAGEPLLKILPIDQESVDTAKLKAAILKRRRQSRRINEEWEAADQEVDSE